MEGIEKKILVVEDEVKISSVVKAFLESKGFTVYCVEDGLKALEIFRHETFDMVILDLMLPGMSGEEVCQALRRTSDVPIIMLTAKSSEASMLKGLGIGADDYITKPFSFKTLYARMEAVWRRTGDELKQSIGRMIFRNGELTMDLEHRYIFKGEEEVKLTPNEYKIVTTMAKNPNKVFTRDELITLALGEEFEGFDRTIDSHIKNLRAKLEDDPRNPIYIKTIRGVGYRFGGGEE